MNLLRPSTLAIGVLIGALLGFGLPLFAQVEPDMREAPVPDAEKSREFSLVLFCGPNDEGEFGLHPVTMPSPTIDVVRWEIEGPGVQAKIEEACKGFKHVYARVKGTRAMTKLMVKEMNQARTQRELYFKLTMNELEWVKNPDEWFQATQQTETKAIQACNLIIARELAKAVAALKDAQGLAENIEYGSNPFEPFGRGAFGWSNMVATLELVQKDEETFRAEGGGFPELQALVRFYYEWGQTLPQAEIPRMGFQTSEVIDGLMKTSKYYSNLARQRLVAKLKSGALALTPADTEKAAKEWHLGYITSLAYLLYQSGKYGPAHNIIRDAILLKDGSDLRPKEDMLLDLVGWVGANKDFAAAISAPELAAFPGTVEKMLEKLGGSENLVRVKQDTIEGLKKLKATQGTVSFAPPIDEVIQRVEKSLPAADDEHSGH